MAEENLSTVGIIRITDIDFQNGNACVGLDIFSGFRAQGRALPVFKMAVKYCFDVLRLHRVWLLVKEGNTPAIKTYRKAGFRLEGAMRQHLYRDGLYHDYLLYGLLREEWERDRTAV
jgi:RimJ/RimL family protein N-acetyltransferase